MKDLLVYIKESFAAKKNSNVFTFNFKDLPDGKDTLKNAIELAEQNNLAVTTTDDTLTIEVTDDLKVKQDKINPVRDLLEQYAADIRKDTKNASSESFAQLTKRFADTVKAFGAYLTDEPEPEEVQKEIKKDDEE